MMAAVGRKKLFLMRKCCSRCSISNLYANLCTVSEFPPIKPKYPKGSWYSFTPKEAWKWYEDVEAIDRLPTVEERLYYNHGSKNQLYYFDVKPFHRTPNVVNFQEEITKSVLDSSVKIPITHDLPAARWSSIVSDIHSTLVEEWKYIVRHDKSATKAEWEAKKRRYVLNSVMSRLIVNLTADQPGLLQYDMDRDVNVQTHWIRGSEKTPVKTFCEVLPNSGIIRFGYRQTVDFQFRNPLPFCDEDIDGGVESFAKVTDPAPPEEFLQYYVEAHKERLDREDTGEYSPHNQGYKKTCYSLPHQPGFLYGAPAEFVNLSVISPDAVKFKQILQLSKKDSEECYIGTGLVHAFATAHAVAHYQGYDMHHDLVSPLITQAMVTDGHQFTCVNYQLNTLRLFVHDIDNNKYNGYNPVATEHLYHTLDDHGNFIGFNPECIKLIGRCMLGRLAKSVVKNPHLEHEQMKTPSSGDLLPYLPTYPRRKPLPDLEEGSVKIPTFVRYTRGEDRWSEWDLPNEKRLQRIKERHHEHEFTKGPLSDRAEPPARGRTDLGLHFAKVRREEREKRIKWRDQIVEYKKSQRNSLRQREKLAPPES